MQRVLCILFLVASTSLVAQTNPNALEFTIGVDSGQTAINALEDTTQERKVASSLPVSLDIEEYWVVDTAESISFRLHVRNSTDSLVIIDRVEPSCGCILTTIQKSFARKNKDGEIYIALIPKRMSDIQPYTVDVYTSVNPGKPLRLYIRKKLAHPDEE